MQSPYKNLSILQINMIWKIIYSKFKICKEKNVKISFNLPVVRDISKLIVNHDKKVKVD
jgi:hypothetical protein